MVKKKGEEAVEGEVVLSREDIDKENESFAKSIVKTFNKEQPIAYDLSDDTTDNPTDVKQFISTGSTILDYLISNRRDGGIPVGKITEISGDTSTGKSLMVCHAIANAQKMGGIAALIDTENAANPDFMKRLGVDLKKLIYLQPETIEEAFEAIEKILIKTREKFPNKEKVVLIVWDSVGGTPPGVEIEGDYDPNSRVGVAAKTMSKGLRKLTKTVGKEHITLLCSNQLTTAIGVMYGDPFVSKHGKALPFHASVRVRLNAGKGLKVGEEIVGVSGTAKVVKTRLGPPFRKASYTIMFDHGIDDESSWYTFLHEKGLIRKAGGWSYLEVDGKEVTFNAGKWKQQLKDPKFRATVLDLLEQNLVKNFDSSDLDPEVVQESEEVVQEE